VNTPADLSTLPPSDTDDPNLTTTVFAPLDHAHHAGGEVDLLLYDLQVPTRPTSRAAEHDAQDPGVHRKGGGRAVLVVDPTPIARKFLTLRLQSLGYAVQVADSGEQALGMLEQQAFAIVFLESVLGPDDSLDGLHLCRAVKQMPKAPGAIEPAVVMVTRLAGASDRVRGSLAGCDAYLSKPIVEAEFLAALAEVDPLFR
jgi:CheY-like chemotaxis protein